MFLGNRELLTEQPLVNVIGHSGQSLVADPLTVLPSDFILWTTVSHDMVNGDLILQFTRFGGEGRETVDK